MESRPARALKIGEFIPVMKPLYASTSELMEAHNGRTIAEVKHDGYRIQIHKNKRRSWLYTARGNEYNYDCYPDVNSIVTRLPTGIFEAELVGPGRSHKEVFDSMKARFRNKGLKQKTVDAYLDSGIVSDVPLHIVLFDVLKFERRGLLEVPYSQRKEYALSVHEQGVDHPDSRIVTSLDELDGLLDRVLDSEEEGLVCKDPGSIYRPGSANTDWVKFKRGETLDLVVVGFYRNEEYAGELPFTSVLCAAYNDRTDKYETIGKIGVTREGIAHGIEASLTGAKMHSPPTNLALSEKLDRDAYAKYVPDSYIQPEESVVLEVKAMNLNRAKNWHTCGLSEGKAYSMRIGFSQGIRHDKDAKMATKTRAIEKLYQLQAGGKK